MKIMGVCMRWISVVVTFITFTASTMVRADEDSYVNYDSIISELKASAEEPLEPARTELDWDEVALHGGLALTTTYLNITSPMGVEGTGLLKGFEAHVGANLFTRKARAEMIYRNFARESLNTDFQADLREIELRVVFLPVLKDRMRLRMGAGLSARTMEISSRNNSRWQNYSQSTPASSLLLGFERRLTKTVTLGPDLAYRSALISDSFDRSAWDAALRLNATF